MGIFWKSSERRRELIVPSLKPTFEESLSIINVEIAKRRHKWNLTSISWMDYDDVSQIIRIHIYKKWEQYESSRPLAPWLNTIITNQIRNLIRNHYSNFSRPCLKCAAATSSDGCEIYKTQCSDCPLFAYWQKHKQPATNIKIPVSIENHVDEVSNISDSSSDVSLHIEEFNKKMQEVLKPLEWLVYKGMYIQNKDETIVAKELGFISNEKGRNPGYKQIKNLRKIIILKAKKLLNDGEIDIV